MVVIITIPSLPLRKKYLKRGNIQYKVKNLDIIDFQVFENLNECIDSLLFDDTTIAQLETKEYIVRIEVIGDIRIFYKGNLYKCSGNFPNELKEIIRSGNILEHDEIEVVDNNWFEIDIYEVTKNHESELINDEVLDDIDISAITKDDLKQYMFKYLKDYLEICKKKIPESEYDMDI